jgi:hypothetical protein
MMNWITVNNELESIEKAAVVVLFKVLCHHLPEGTEENHEKLGIFSVPAKILNTRTSQKHFRLS